MICIYTEINIKGQSVQKIEWKQTDGQAYVADKNFAAIVVATFLLDFKAAAASEPSQAAAIFLILSAAEEIVKARWFSDV